MLTTFYNNISDDRYINKRITITHDDVDIEYKEATGLIRPQFIVSTPLIGQATNYLYVAELKRYYYIRNITFEHQRCILDCEVDVLMSYKQDIMNRTVILDRQQNRDLYNLYLDDPEFKLYQYSNVYTVPWTKGFSSTAQTFLLTVVGSVDSEGGE